ncbi:IclR family transcriptional regulator [Haloglycomyces albus]|uniref:IclR family transcriptional regulator n=1 Tax=Haloglycomyces albus TaxID=526067 RepID=UPI00046D37A9|nr:IclR family transcriptional regulator C-terminal domain-containing protein [Haloglycomyces albus]
MGDSKKPGGAGGTIQSVQRALRIMEFIGRHPNGVSAQRVAHEFKLGRATAYNLLRTMVKERYVMHGEDGRFMLGTQVTQRYSDLTRSLSGPGDINGLVNRLVSETGYSVFLASMIDEKVTLVDVIEGKRSPHVEDLVVGFDEGAHATAFGKALLATLPEEKRLNYVGEYGMRPFTRNTVTDYPHLDYDLRVSSNRGVYLEMEQYRPDISCAAVLVPSLYQQRNPISIATAVPTEHMSRWKPLITKRLTRAAREMSVFVGR